MQKKPEKNKYANGSSAYQQVEPPYPSAQYLLWYITGKLLWSFGDNKKNYGTSNQHRIMTLLQFLSAETLLFPS